MVQPRYFIPIHGEYRHLMKHRQLAMSLGMSPANCLLIENGAIICLGRDTVYTKDKIETGRVFVDGKGVGDVGGLVLRDRRHLSEDGLVIASLVVNKETHEILSGPDIFSRGFIHEETKPEILFEAKCVIFEAIDRQLEEDHQLDCVLLQDEIRRELKRFFNRILDRRPVIYPIVVEI
jgi:ribonuclease J